MKNQPKGRIYHDFINEIEHDDEEHEIRLTNVKRKRLTAFLYNEVVQNHLMSSEGPIERIYSKVAEHSSVDRDTIAQFIAEDFMVTTDLFEDIHRAGADPKAEKMARELMADDSGMLDATKIANYLNQFVNDVIQRCAGIEPGDFRDIFQDIRKELYRIGKGVGVLVLRKKKYKLPPVKAIMYGGQQERGIRPGTIPVALVAGCGKACELAESTYADNRIKTQAVRDCIIGLLNESGIKYSFNGALEYCISNTLNLCLEGVSSEALMISTKNYCGISNGSACTSKNYAPSYVLTAMGLSPERIENSVRISWGPDTDINLLKTDFRKLIEIAKMLAQ